MQNEDILAPLPMVSGMDALPSLTGNLRSDLPGDPIRGSAAQTAGPATPPTKLDGRTKAAIVVRLLLNEGADIPLEDLPEPLQAQLTQQMGRMRLVDRQTLGAVVHEFADALDGVGLSFPNGLAGALNALDGKISPQTAARLRREAGVRRSGDPWTRLRALPVDTLAEIAQAESTEIAAVLLSKLDVSRAAELLGTLPGPVARRITYAVSQTGAVTPEAVDRIGLSLASQLDNRPIPAFDDGPGERVGAILNQSAAATRDDVLSALEETDAEFAARVRRAIFVFEHIPARVNPLDVPRVVRAVNADEMVTALAAAADGPNAQAAEFLLGNMSTRLADNMREEVAERGAVKPRDGEAAMNNVITAIRDLISAGEIEMVTDESEESG